uniref:MHD domain-containing protein n=1 Tax=Angiostrongylus cantonensis TaxID=6313 RepID=A0A0K0D1S0_ANGCA
MVLHKQQRRTPRDVKKGSTTKVNTGQEIPIDRYLDPNWEKTPSFESQKKLHVITEYSEFESSDMENHYHEKASLHVYQTESNQGISVCLQLIRPRKKTGVNKITYYVAKFPGATMPIWRIEVPLPNGAKVPQHSPPPTPPSSQPSPIHSTNEPSLTVSQNDHSVTMSVPSELPTSAPPPPPPPPSLLSPAPTPPPSTEPKRPMFDIALFNTNGRKSLLESPTGGGGLLSAIQAELDKRREYIVTDSDCEADSTDSEWTD